MGEQSFRAHGRHGRRHGVEGFAHGVMAALAHALDAEAVNARTGLLQGLDPRAKVACVLALIVGALLTRSLAVLALLLGLAVVLAAASHVSPLRLARQVWAGVLLFTGAIALPAVFIVPGQAVWRLPGAGWVVTLQGLRSAAFLVGRAEVSATLALLLILTTPWPHVLKALRALGVPVVVVAILGMTHRYVFVLLQAAAQMAEGRRSRLMTRPDAATGRRMAASAMGTLLARALQLSTEVHQAMVARGYRGEVHLLHAFRTRPRDWLALAGAVAVPLLVLAWGPR